MPGRLGPLRLAVLLLFAIACSPLACGLPPLSAYARPPVRLAPLQAIEAWHDARDVFERRCVVCHGCYDAPCQLKLGTYEGIERGATDAVVYDGARLFPTSPTRLEIDAHGTPAWRAKGFHPVLPEGMGQDPRASVLLRMLDLKRAHPLPAADAIASSFTLDLDRTQTCTTAERFDAYARQHPLWGMPYGLPGLAPSEDAALVQWVKGGAPHDSPPPVPSSVATSVTSWERFLNESPLKNRLAGRYIYEHLFLASLYFEEGAAPTYFRLVRSRTRDGAIDEIATRRPFDDPQVSRVYYRLARRVEQPLEKTHMPYALSEERLARYRTLLIETPYVVEALPSYESEASANPFRTFQAIPAASRYRFLLEQAELVIMGFIKGPVCRGQVALNVIEDRFWVTFMNPDLPMIERETDFLAKEQSDLGMPAEGGSFAFPTQWLRYGSEHERYLSQKDAFLRGALPGNGDGSGGGAALDLVWDGDGKSSDASLTVFRHFDSASVVRGLVGRPPKTAWIVGFPLLERIHYLLVAGFDVFGNVGHQLTTRLYMDFLRMEGEANLLLLLPPQRRLELVALWYRGVGGAAKERIVHDLTMFTAPPRIPYQTGAPEAELFALLEKRLRPTLPHDLDPGAIEDRVIRAAAAQLALVTGPPASWLPELSFVSVPDASGRGAGDTNFTIARESGHTNVAHLFREDERRLRSEDALSVLPGLVGAYPNALFEVPRQQLDAFVQAVATLDGAASYHALRARFGVLRSSERFWSFSDRIRADHARSRPITGGAFDFNRLEAF